MLLDTFSWRCAAAAVGLAISWLPGSSHAEDTQACATINADHERLACYDRAMGRAATDTPMQEATMLEEAWGFDSSSPRYLLRYHRMNYFLPITYTSDRNIEPWEPFRQLEIQDGEINLDDAEAKFQISFRYRLWAKDDKRLGLWFGYTQLSTWQIYNDAESRPFRDTNYQPELILSYNPGLDIGSFRWSLLNFGFNHESNGRAYVVTRSWDRLFAEAGFENGNFALLAKAWYRIPDGDDDDNPEITDYYGHGQITAFYRRGESSFTLTGRGNWNRQKGAVEASFVSPPLIGPLRGYLQVFSGYGETMIDYNWKQTVIGAGISINSIL